MPDILPLQIGRPRQIIPVGGWIIPLCLTLLAGCTSPIPDAIRQPVPGNVSISEVQADPQQYVGTRVRWGGHIVAIDNQKAETQVEVVSRELSKGGRPAQGDRSEGRFIARVAGFLDPAVYKEGDALTITGTVEEVVRRSIGEHPYQYPVVHAQAWYRWEPLPPASRCYYCDPFWYDPWYPYYYGPWWHHPHRHYYP